MIPYKVCCIRSIEEVERAAAAGAWAVGLVGPMPSGPGVLELDAIAAIAARVPPHVLSVLLTSKIDPAPIIAEVEATGVRAAQLVDAVSDEALATVRAALPDLVIIQVIHVQDSRDVDEAARLSEHPAVDYLLLDSGRPREAIPILGGTGQIHDWSLSRQIIARSRVPVLLAGGLNPQNVAEALDVGPWGLDICSGLRRPDDYALDPDKLSSWSSALERLAAGQARDESLNVDPDEA